MNTHMSCFLTDVVAHRAYTRAYARLQVLHNAADISASHAWAHAFRQAEQRAFCLSSGW